MCKRGTRIRKRISIHAPAKGATLCFLLLIVNKCHFNPRSREGSDQGAVAGSTIDVISIHAPAKGATRKSSGIKSRAFISIHAPAKGATADAAMLYLAGVFQSTLPRRERHLAQATLQDFLSISIHAPAKGATVYDFGDITYNRISIHAPAKGATGEAGTFNVTTRISIHAPAKGATESRLCDPIKQK